MDLDKIDVKILGLLQSRARLSNARLAAAVNLSQSACLARVRRLEAAGYIRGYAALLDMEKLGASVSVLAAITLDKQGKEHQARFEATLKASAEIVESWVVSGAVDYLALFVCRDLARYHAITEALLAADDLGVKHIDSHIVLRPLKAFHGVDLQALTPVARRTSHRKS
jgi:Lrp/AsnC family leucine-responsive transcriptional regulator